MKSKVYLVEVTSTTKTVYEVAATSRREAAQDVKKLSDHHCAMSYNEVRYSHKRRITSVITKDLIPKEGTNDKFRGRKIGGKKKAVE